MKTKLSRQTMSQPAPLSRIVGPDTVPDSEDVIEVAPVLMHLKTILVPVDFSSYSTKALNYALKFAQQFDASIAVVHVVEPIPILPTDVLAPAPTPDTTEDRIQAIESKLKGMCKKAAKAHRLNITPFVVTGVPYAKITDIAEEQNADLIVIATHGYTGFKHFYMGSTTERVVRHAPCPVLVVRDKERDFVNAGRR